jgi:hypothetical protein
MLPIGVCADAEAMGVVLLQGSVKRQGEGIRGFKPWNDRSYPAI